MFKIFKKTPETTTWSDYGQQEEVVNGDLVITINEKSSVEDLNRSIVDFMSGNGMSHKYKVTVSKIEEEEK